MFFDEFPCVRFNMCKALDCYKIQIPSRMQSTQVRLEEIKQIKNA